MASPLEPDPLASIATPPAGASILRSRFVRILAPIALAFVLGVVWCAKYRGTGWTAALNPMNWFRQSQSSEPFIASDGLLQRGDPSKPEIALTFDDGPHPESRAAILDTLKRYHVRATFFDVGVNMERHPDLLLRTIAEGHEIANHSENHQRLDGLTPLQRHREINDTDIAYCSVTDKHLSLLRPPGMRYNPEVLSDTRELGYVVVGYTNAARDFELNEDPKVIAERSLTHLSNGGILLLHDYPSTAGALPAILDGIRQRGLTCVTVSEMLDHLPEPYQTAAREYRRKAGD